MEILLLYSLFILVPPLLLVSVVLLWKDSTHWRRYLWLYTLFVALLAYSFVPKPESGDLVRYLERLDIYKQYSLKEILAMYPYRELGENVWIWIVSKMGLPGLLPGIAAAIVYGVSSYITCDYAERKNRPEIIKWVLLIQAVILPFGSIVYNIFNVSAFAIILLAAYRDLIQEKKNILTIVLYVVACLIQQSAFILIVARILAIPAKRMRIASVGIIAVVPGLMNLLYASRSMFEKIPIVYSLIERGNYYLSETSDSDYAIKVRTVIWYRLNFVVCIGFAILFIIAAFRIMRRAGTETLVLEKGENTFLSFLFLVGILSISCVAFSAPHYWRFILVDQMAVVVFVLLNNRDRVYKAWKYAFAAIASLQLIIQNYRLFKSLVIVDEWMRDFLLASPVQILYRLVKMYVMS